MGLFDFLFGGKGRANTEAAPDEIWLTTEAKFAGLARRVGELAATETARVLLVAHFPDVLARLEQIARQQTSGAPVQAVLADHLNSHFAAGWRQSESDTIDIIVAERHLLTAEDQRLAEFAEELPCRCRLSHHLSLEDPLMSVFAGEWVQGVLGGLGMTEQESIQSDMVSRRIRQAQKKIEQQAQSTGLRASSADEWLANNCPDRAGR